MDNENLHNINIQLTDEVSKFKKDYKIQEQINKSLEKELKKIKEESTNIILSSENIIKENKLLKENLNKTIDDKQKIVQDFDDLVKDRETLNMNMDKLLKDSQKDKKIIKMFAENESKLRSSFEKLMNEKKNDKATIENLISEKIKIKNVLEKIIEEKKENTSNIEKLASDREKANAYANKLKKENQNLNINLDKMIMENKTLESTIESIKQENHQLNEKRKEWLEEWEVLIEQRTQLIDESCKKQNEILAVNEQLNSLKRELEKEKASKMVIINNNKERVIKIQSEIKNLQETLDHSTSQLKQFQSKEKELKLYINNRDELLKKQTLQMKRIFNDLASNKFNPPEKRFGNQSKQVSICVVEDLQDKIDDEKSKMESECQEMYAEIKQKQKNIQKLNENLEILNDELLKCNNDSIRFKTGVKINFNKNQYLMELDKIKQKLNDKINVNLQEKERNKKDIESIMKRLNNKKQDMTFFLNKYKKYINTKVYDPKSSDNFSEDSDDNINEDPDNFNDSFDYNIINSYYIKDEPETIPDNNINNNINNNYNTFNNNNNNNNNNLNNNNFNLNDNNYNINNNNLNNNNYNSNNNNLNNNNYNSNNNNNNNNFNNNNYNLNNSNMNNNLNHNNVNNNTNNTNNKNNTKNTNENTSKNNQTNDNNNDDNNNNNSVAPVNAKPINSSEEQLINKIDNITRELNLGFSLNIDDKSEITEYSYDFSEDLNQEHPDLDLIINRINKENDTKKATKPENGNEEEDGRHEESLIINKIITHHEEDESFNVIDNDHEIMHEEVLSDLSGSIPIDDIIEKINGEHGETSYLSTIEHS